jgi:hypothetical protein
VSIYLGLDAPLDSPLSGSISSPTSLVPAQFDVALNGQPYMLDLANDLNGFRGTHFTRKSVNLLRSQADTANVPGEQSLNREDLWRRTQESWFHGAGQTNLDRADSDIARFRTSKGINPWVKWELSLLNDTSRVLTSANTNLRLTACGTNLYLADGNTLSYSANVAGGVFTAVTGTPASPCSWLTTDGFTVYAAYGTALYSTTRGAATAASFATGFVSNVTLTGYVKGRLLVAAANVLYNVTAPGVAPTPLYTHPNTDFAWVGFAEGPGQIYAAGFSGTRSLIYKTSVLPDGTALAVPSAAGELPTGETVRSIKGYAGLIIVGTDNGIRLANPDGAGNLNFGPLIPTTSPVLNFEPQNRFVWYGLTNYDSTSTGLGRLDLSVFTDALAPAYASDVMATTQGSVLSVSSFGTMRVFTISGSGVWVETINKVPTGSLVTGKIAFGIGDDKVAMYLDVRTQPLQGSVGLAIAAGGGAAVTLDTFTTPGLTRPSAPVNVQQQRAEFFELTLMLNRDAVVTAGPTLNRFTLRAYPAPSRSSTFVVPVILHERVLDRLGHDYTLDVYGARLKFEALLRSQALVNYQEGNQSYTVLVDDLIWIPFKRTLDGSTFSGTLVALLKEVVA